MPLVFLQCGSRDWKARGFGLPCLNLEYLLLRARFELNIPTVLRSLCLPSQPERADLLAQLASLTTTSTQLKAELEAYGAADPIKMETKRQAIELAKEACVLWTGTFGKKKRSNRYPFKRV